MAQPNSDFRVHKQRGKWAVLQKVVGPDGKPKWPHIKTFTLKGEAKAYRDELIRSGVIDATTTLGRFVMEVWLPDSEDLKPSAQASRDWAAMRICEALGHVRLCDLTLAHLKTALSGWKSQPTLARPPQKPVHAQETISGDEQPAKPKTLSPRTVATLTKRLQSVMALVMAEGLLSKNPAARLRTPRVKKKKRPIWDDAQLGAFLVVAAEDDLAAAWVTEVASGLRRSELLGLTWDRIDWIGMTLTVEMTVVYVNGKVIVQDDGKTENAGRTIPMSAGVMEFLDAHHKRQDEHYKLLELPDDQRQPFVFTNPTFDGPFSPATFTRRFGKLCKRAGVPPIRLHDMRHTYASRLLNAMTSAGDLMAATELMGHGSAALLTDVYGKALAGAARDLQQRFLATLDGVIPEPPVALAPPQPSPLVRPSQRRTSISKLTGRAAA